MVEISEIKDIESLEVWLESQPRAWAQVIAIRLALRIAPVAFSLSYLPEQRLLKKHRENFILLTFRATLITSASSKYSTDDLNDHFAAIAADAIFADDAADAAADVADAAAYAVACATNNASYIADVVAYSAYAARADASIWKSIRADMMFLYEEPSDDAFAHSDSARMGRRSIKVRELMNQPLWLAYNYLNKVIPLRPKGMFGKDFSKFKNSKLANETNFGLIADWYQAALQGKSAFGKKAELAIAKMSPEDWGDNDKERDCVAVMDRVAQLAGWERKTYKEEPHNDVQNSETSGKSNNGFTNHNVSKGLNDNREAILSLCQSLLMQLSEYKQKIQFTNQFGEDYKKELLSFLEKIEDDLRAIMGAVPEIGKQVEKPKVDETVTRLNRFKARFKQNLPKYFEPEHLGDISPPVSIILGCGAVGSFFGGPIGFGAGAFVGKLLTNEIKPGKVDDKVQEMLDNENPSTS